MNYKYDIVNGKATIFLDKRVYPLDAVKKAMFYYVKDAYMCAEIIINKIKVEIEVINKEKPLEILTREFLNDCLRESLRYDISKQTKNIRELIVGRALYTSCIEIDENNNDKENLPLVETIEDEDFDLDEIAVNWFNKKEDI